ncbi:pseudouridine synthase [Amorphus coralli]|uniref:pseudouridine synthase n=1 Tax=Amorphus coralli TaxID=340680 RepID=UPI001AEC38CC|nr:pseudouridine synthase [Amorphus coralli]
MSDTPETPSQDRIAKVMARAGLCSRREAEVWIAEGRVAVNGQTLETPAVTVSPDDKVTVDGKPLPVKERTRLWLYHKPRGLVTTAYDPQGRPTVFERLPETLPRVMSVGRLDINTEGLLLLTNDGGLSRVLELPTTGWLRKYRVRAHGRVTQADLDTLKDGIAVDGVLYGGIEAKIDHEQGANVWMTIGLREGKNREIKNVLGALGMEVSRLIRVSFGPFQLGDVPLGQAVEVAGRTLRDQLGRKLADAANADFTAPIHTQPVRQDGGDRPRGGSHGGRGAGPARDERAGGGRQGGRSEGWGGREGGSQGERTDRSGRGGGTRGRPESGRRPYGSDTGERGEGRPARGGGRFGKDERSGSRPSGGGAGRGSRREGDSGERRFDRGDRPQQARGDRPGGERGTRGKPREAEGPDRSGEAPWQSRGERTDRPGRSPRRAGTGGPSRGPGGEARPRGGYGGKPGGGFKGKPRDDGEARGERGEGRPARSGDTGDRRGYQGGRGAAPRPDRPEGERRGPARGDRPAGGAGGAPRRGPGGGPGRPRDGGDGERGGYRGKPRDGAGTKGKAPRTARGGGSENAGESGAGRPNRLADPSFRPSGPKPRNAQRPSGAAGRGPRKPGPGGGAPRKPGGGPKKGPRS